MSLPPIALYVNFYLDKSHIRQNELNFCQKMNGQLNSIDKIYFIVDNLELFKQWTLDFPKIKLIYLKERPTFTLFFQIANRTQSHPQQINIVANTDIYFTSSLDLLKPFVWQNRALCLSRQDTVANDSQDVWAWQENMKNISSASDFYLGIPGCDNRIAHVIQASGYKPHNPAKTIIAHHVHASMIRNYSESSRIHGDYAFVGPVYLGEESPLTIEEKGTSENRGTSKRKSRLSRSRTRSNSKPIPPLSRSQSKQPIPLKRSQSVVIVRSMPMTHKNLKRNHSIVVARKPTTTTATVRQVQRRNQPQRLPQRVIKRMTTLQHRRQRVTIVSRRTVSSRRVAIRTARRN